MDLTDRPSALLTPRQREIISGEEDIGERAHRAARARIRERLRASIFDLQLIASELPLDEIDKALAEPDDYEREPGTSPPVANNMIALPALLYLYHREAEAEAPNQPDGWRTAADVERGVDMALTRMGVGYDQLEVDMNVTRGGELKTLAEGDLAELSHDQLLQMLSADVIDEVEFSQAVVERQERLEEYGTGEIDQAGNDEK